MCTKTDDVIDMFHWEEFSPCILENKNQPPA